MNPAAGAFVLAITLASSAVAQETELLAEGKVTDAKTNKGIKASIRYSSLPTGSIYGKFTDSLFSFTIFGTARYQITAEAQGYNPKTIILDPKDLPVGETIQREIRLIPYGETVRLEHLIFAQGKSTIGKESFGELDEIVSLMQQNTKIVIQLEGHTDNLGNARANLKLSEDRVKAVKKYITRKGIGKSRVKTIAYGSTRPLTIEQTPQARALNRRVELRILEE